MWDTTRYGDTINERAVRILLECILVVHSLVCVASRVSIIFHKFGVNEYCQDKFCIGGKKVKLPNVTLVAKSGQVGSSCKFNKKDPH